MNMIPTITLDRYGSLYVPMIDWMKQQHKERLLEIEALSFPFPWSWDDFVRVLRNRNCLGQIVAIRGDVAAYMVYELGKRSFIVHNLAVSPHIRRRGLGRLLVRQLQQKIDARRRRAISALVSERNVEGQLFFRSLGFRCEEIVSGYFKDGQQGYRFILKEKDDG